MTDTIQVSKRKRTKSETKPLTVGYVRVSTEEQARDGVSLAAQSQRIEAFAVATGRELSEIVMDEGLSAKTLARPELQRILEGVRTGRIGTVIVLKLDRLTRSIRDLGDLLETFRKAGADLVSVSESLDTSTAAGRMVVNLLGVFAEFEREQVGERTTFAISYKRRMGAVYGPTPFGWIRDGDRLVRDEREQSALRTAMEMHEDGQTLRSIGAWLTRSGFMPKRGGKAFYAATVRSMLSSRISAEMCWKE
jgi:site-specific DNA recombinase